MILLYMQPELVWIGDARVAKLTEATSLVDRQPNDVAPCLPGCDALGESKLAREVDEDRQQRVIYLDQVLEVVGKLAEKQLGFVS